MASLMENVLNVNNVGDYSAFHGVESPHPLVALINFEEISPIRHSLNKYSVYGLFMNRNLSIDLTYGCGKYDYTNGTLICVAPGQIGGKPDNGDRIELDGWSLMFHPDFLNGTPLGKRIREYSFFDYRVNEALHMTEEEFAIFDSLMRHMRAEISGRRDSLQDGIIIGYIELMLNYCQRFYDRQFMTRRVENNDLMSRFKALLHGYFHDNMQAKHGLPSMQYFADRLNMSANYLGDLIKKTSGSTAMTLIRAFVIQEAKNALASGKSVSEAAYYLGFDYPQHLSRMFKKNEGMSPSQYLDSIRR